MGIFWKAIAAIVGGLLFAILASVVVALSGLTSGESAGGALFWFSWLGGAVIAFLAPTAGKAWRYLLICCALLALAMPLSSMIFAGNHFVESSAQGAGAAAGSAIGGGLAAAMTGVVGFFLAAIFLIIGLLVGKDRPAPQ